MANLGLVLLVFAFVCASIAAFITPPDNPNRVRLIAASIAFWTAAELFGGLQRFIH